MVAEEDLGEMAVRLLLSFSETMGTPKGQPLCRTDIASLRYGEASVTTCGETTSMLSATRG